MPPSRNKTSIDAYTCLSVLLLTTATSSLERVAGLAAAYKALELSSREREHDHNHDNHQVRGPYQTGLGDDIIHNYFELSSDGDFKSYFR